MKVVIIEDETPAAEKLQRYLQRYDPGIEVLAQLDSVESSIQWIQENQSSVDLFFMDIQLLDGLSLEIFDQVNLEKPVIFTTAFDQYAIEAFKVNSIDYLLKPIIFEDLSNAIKKWERLRKDISPDKSPQIGLEEYRKALAIIQGKKSYKTRFMVKLGEHIRSIPTDKVAVFYAEGRNGFIRTTNGGKFVIDYKLEELETLLDPALFFRVNRTYIVNLHSIKDVIVYSNSRLKVITDPVFEKEIIVSREKVGSFKEWFDGR
jgi:DNA-binding LytR/AlgR family response regulator